MTDRTVWRYYILLIPLAFLPSMIFSGGVIASAIVMTFYGLFGVYLIRKWIPSPDWATITISRAQIVGLVLIFTLFSSYVFHISNGNYHQITNKYSAIISLFILIINIFVIPLFIHPYSALAYISRISAILVAIGIGLIIGAMSGIIPESYVWTEYFQISSFHIPYLMSILDNPNVFGRIVFVGLIAAVAEYTQTEGKTALLLISINGAGLLMTSSRASWAAAAVALLLYFSYRLLGLRGVSMAIIVALPTTVILGIFLIGAYLSGGGTTLSGRFVLWEASIRAIAERPTVGYGLGYSGAYIEPFVQEARFAGDATHNR